MSNITPTIHTFDSADEDAFFNNIREVSTQNQSEQIVTERTENDISQDLRDYEGNEEFYKFLKSNQLKLDAEKLSVNTNPGSFNLKELKSQNPVVADTKKSLVDEATKPKTQHNKQEYSDDSYYLAFEFIKENNLLNIPEGVELNNETLSQILEYDNQKRVDQAFDYIKSQAGDQHIAELLEMVINGGTLEDLETGKDIIGEEAYLQSLDASDEDVQRRVLATYLKQGLDINIPSQAELISEIPERVSNIIASYKGEERTLKAIDYFLNDVKIAKRDFETAKQNKIAEQTAIRAAKFQREETWKNTFINGLKDRNWANNKKNEVWSHFNNVTLTDGTVLPLWDYKLKKIWENPKHTHLLFKFLTEFDQYTNDFKSPDKTPNQLATDKIMEMANRKSVSRSTTSHERNNDKEFSRENIGNFVDKQGVSYTQ